MNQTDICNLALSRIGTGSGNKIININTELTRTCISVYDNDLTNMLLEYQWPFTIQRWPLVIAPNFTVKGHTYVYTYPIGTLMLLGVTSAEGNPIVNGKRENVDYEIYNDDVNLTAVIATSQPNAYAWRICQLAIEYTPAYFQNAFAWKLAGSLAIALKTDPKLAQFAQEQYTIALGSALALAANEHGRRAVRFPETIAAMSLSSSDSSSGSGAGGGEIGDGNYVLYY